MSLLIQNWNINYLHTLLHSIYDVEGSIFDKHFLSNYVIEDAVLDGTSW